MIKKKKCYLGRIMKSQTLGPSSLSLKQRTFIQMLSLLLIFPNVLPSCQPANHKMPNLLGIKFTPSGLWQDFWSIIFRHTVYGCLPSFCKHVYLEAGIRVCQVMGGQCGMEKLCPVVLAMLCPNNICWFTTLRSTILSKITQSASA